MVNLDLVMSKNLGPNTQLVHILQQAHMIHRLCTAQTHLVLFSLHIFLARATVGALALWITSSVNMLIGSGYSQ